MKKELRNNLVSLCRETAKSLDMSREGSRWICETTDIEIRRDGRKHYRFYVLDRNSNREYQAEATIYNEQDAEWNVEEVE